MASSPAAATLPHGLADKVQAWPLARLTPYKQNPRKHEKAAIAQMAKVLEQFGMRPPLLVKSDGEICDGHLRALAARSLKLETVPVILCDDWSAEQIRAYRMLSRNSATWSKWDDELVALELKELDAASFDVTLTGFTDAELRDRLGKPAHSEGAGGDGENDSDGAPLSAPAIATTAPGDLYKLGEHRLLCADALDSANVKRVTGGEPVDAVFTDPPYAIYGSSTGIAADIADDKMVAPFFRAVFHSIAGAVRHFAHVYIACDWRSWASIWTAASASGIAPKNQIVWDKGGGLGFSYMNSHELLYFGARTPQRTHMRDREEDTGHRPCRDVTVWRINRVASGIGEGREHNAQKPLELVRRALTNSTEAGERVLDLFGGSGTTLIACEEMGRRCCMLELSPAYCDVIVARWERLTGRKAERLAAGD